MFSLLLLFLFSSFVYKLPRLSAFSSMPGTYKFFHSSHKKNYTCQTLSHIPVLLQDSYNFSESFCNTHSPRSRTPRRNQAMTL